MNIEVRCYDYTALISFRHGKAKVDHCSSMVLVGSSDPFTAIGQYIIFLLQVQAAVYRISTTQS